MSPGRPDWPAGRQVSANQNNGQLLGGVDCKHHRQAFNPGVLRVNTTWASVERLSLSQLL